MEQAMETIRIQAKWLERDGGAARKWLQAQIFSV